MKSKRKKLIESAVSRRAKLLENHVLGLGQLPSSKLMKMKWNPITGKTLKEQDVPAAPPAPAEAPTIENVLNDIDGLLKKWPDKEHPYYKDVVGLMTKYANALAGGM